MKKYIHSIEPVHLSNLISKIKYFVVTSDLSNINFGEVHSSEDIEDSEYYASLPDERLLELSKEEVSQITNIYVLDRIKDLDKSKLSKAQIKLLRKEYSKTYLIDDSDRIALLNMFRKCNNIYVEHRDKNLDFLSQYSLKDSDVLAILHNLKLEDFQIRTRSINYVHLGNTLIILTPKVVIPAENIMIGVNLFVKLDIDEGSKSCGVFVSIHPEDENKRNNQNKTES